MQEPKKSSIPGKQRVLARMLATEQLVRVRGGNQDDRDAPSYSATTFPTYFVNPADVD